VAALSRSDRNVGLDVEIDSCVDFAISVDLLQTTPAMAITRAAPAAARGTTVAAIAAPVGHS
jgi:hypothetical protein